MISKVQIYRYNSRSKFQTAKEAKVNSDYMLKLRSETMINNSSKNNSRSISLSSETKTIIQGFFYMTVLKQ